MKVLFYTGTFTHQFYKEQFKCFPVDTELIPSTPDLLATTQIRRDYLPSRFSSFFSSLAKKAGLKTVELFRIPKFFRIDTKNADFVYAAQYLIKNDVDYVSDFEHAAVYSWYNQRLFDSKSFQKKLSRILSKKNLRFLLAWTGAAKQSLVRNIDCSAFADKIKVVYPAIQEKKFKKIRHKGINVLFIGGAFYLKGGMDAVLAFEQVKKLIPGKKICLTVISNNVPKEILEKYGKIVNFKRNLPQKELDIEYRKSDIFLLPTHMDTFGFVLLEAMSYGIPCVTIDTFAVPEIISDGKTGFVVKNSISLYDKDFAYKYNMLDKKENAEFTKLCMNPKEKDVENLAAVLKKLITDSILRNKMSKNCMVEIKNGRFSKKKRVEALRNLFREMK